MILNGETELVPQDIKLFKTDVIVKGIHLFDNFNFYGLIFEFIQGHYKELIDELIQSHIEII